MFATPPFRSFSASICLFRVSRKVRQAAANGNLVVDVDVVVGLENRRPKNLHQRLKPLSGWHEGGPEKAQPRNGKHEIHVCHPSVSLIFRIDLPLPSVPQGAASSGKWQPRRRCRCRSWPGESKAKKSAPKVEAALHSAEETRHRNQQGLGRVSGP